MDQRLKDSSRQLQCLTYNSTSRSLVLLVKQKWYFSVRLDIFHRNHTPCVCLIECRGTYFWGSLLVFFLDEEVLLLLEIATLHVPFP